jgi:hypothetical protein
VTALLDTLQTYDPGNLSDANSLVFAYGQALDAQAVAIFAENSINDVADRWDAGELTRADAISELVAPLLYYELADLQVDYADSVFELGRDLPGPPLAADLDLAATADFFRDAAEANYGAFQASVVHPYATQNDVSDDVMLNALANNDINVALSTVEAQTITSLTDVIGAGKPNAGYAQLGYAMNNYARNAMLIYKYYANGAFDDQGNLTGVQYERAFTSALDLAHDQLAAVVGQLGAQQATPAYQAGLLELADIERDGTLDEKFSALEDYWTGYVSGRVLAYLGGFPATGLSG